MEVPLYDPAEHEILYYVGCTASYDRRAQKVARALVQIFQAAGVRFGILGNEEPCCGEAVLSVGHFPYFQEIAQDTMNRLTEKGIRQIVTVSPHCYDVFRNHYPGFQDRFQLYHYTQYVAQLMEEGRVHFKEAWKGRVTFHDPCYLGRRNGEFEAPRQILAAIPGLDRVEMEHNREDALCCGGGGGRMWLETRPDERFSNVRVREAVAAGARILATACPFCITCLEDSVKDQRISDLRVLDLAEIAAMALSDVSGA